MLPMPRTETRGRVVDRLLSVEELTPSGKRRRTRGPSRPCSVPGCIQRAQGKPWCIEHVTESPYVAGILEHLEERQVG